jgi:hypothetical protein
MIKFNATTRKTANVEFSYSESCKNVYKTFSVEIDGKRSNTVGLRAFLGRNPLVVMLSEDTPDIIGAKTYFWTPCGNASGRRSAERRRNDEVSGWLSDNGFTDSDINLNHLFVGQGRRRGESIGVDHTGYFFQKHGVKFHWTTFRQINIEVGRMKTVNSGLTAKQKRVRRAADLYIEVRAEA